MNVNRLLGIFIASTLLIWILIFALSPQPKYQKINNIKIPELEEPSVNIQEFNKIEFEEVKKNALKLKSGRFGNKSIGYNYLVTDIDEDGDNDGLY